MGFLDGRALNRWSVSPGLGLGLAFGIGPASTRCRTPGVVCLASSDALPAATGQPAQAPGQLFVQQPLACRAGVHLEASLRPLQGKRIPAQAVERIQLGGVWRARLF